jgi:hypothetical protein
VEYQVLSNALYLSSASKARRVEAQLNEMAKQGWRFVSLESITVLGFDVGYYLVVARQTD